eukprot:13737734-Ditylum_brightwellii.AAC.1
MDFNDGVSFPCSIDLRTDYWLIVAQDDVSCRIVALDVVFRRNETKLANHSEHSDNAPHLSSLTLHKGNSKLTEEKLLQHLDQFEGDDDESSNEGFSSSTDSGSDSVYSENRLNTISTLLSKGGCRREENEACLKSAKEREDHSEKFFSHAGAEAAKLDHKHIAGTDILNMYREEQMANTQDNAPNGKLNSPLSTNWPFDNVQRTVETRHHTKIMGGERFAKSEVNNQNQSEINIGIDVSCGTCIIDTMITGTNENDKSDIIMDSKDKNDTHNNLSANSCSALKKKDSLTGSGNQPENACLVQKSIETPAKNMCVINNTKETVHAIRGGLSEKDQSAESCSINDSCSLQSPPSSATSEKLLFFDARETNSCIGQEIETEDILFDMEQLISIKSMASLHEKIIPTQNDSYYNHTTYLSEGDLHHYDNIILPNKCGGSASPTHKPPLLESVHFPSIHDVLYGLHDHVEHEESTADEFDELCFARHEMHPLLHIFHEFFWGPDDDDILNEEVAKGQKIVAQQ